MTSNAEQQGERQGERQRVTLVIPGRNASNTLPMCLDAAIKLLGQDGLEEIIFVDDGSTDDSKQIVNRYPVRYLRGHGKGPGSARNVGWRAAKTPLVWFIDADCVTEEDALQLLLQHLEDDVAAVGGSYGNMREDSLVACLIHHEIIQRHRRMSTDVDMLSSFNVLYRRDILRQVGGFDEQKMVNGRGSAGAEDLELAYRVAETGLRLKFEPSSRVGHFHPTNLSNYMRVQCRHGYWRVPLYVRHSSRVSGDSYCSLLDLVQPPMAMLLVAMLPLLLTSWWSFPAAMAACLLIAQIPMTVRIVVRMRKMRYAGYIPFGFARAFYRGFGMSWATISLLLVPKAVLESGPVVIPVRQVSSTHVSADCIEEC
ncbi:MAG: cellulose synthase/poly-beta-1,6-N-acetylglucosamine synthase-like glycosyltransferase [Pirellulaceae bacterium]|jgi:cellulose synthase/poly-beta-1,6-N-acetylglucosamine synthase-like glycosyltransferase